MVEMVTLRSGSVYIFLLFSPNANPKLETDMLNDYKRWAERIGLTPEDSDAVLSEILTQYKLRDEAERQGCDWGDIIAEILDEKNISFKYLK